MSPGTAAVRAGLSRGWIEFRQTVTNPAEFLGMVWPWPIALVVMFALRNSTVPGTNFSLGSQSIPGLLGVNVVFTGMLGLTMALIVAREDGTLLRMKATPNGMVGYLTGQVVNHITMTVAMLLIVLIPAAFLFDGLELRSVSSWLALTAVLVLGLAAVLPFGAILGSLFRNVGSAGFATLVVTGLIGISGIFYPITALPGWLQWIGQAFPVYWIGLGMRSALLPADMAAAEIGDSWRHLETFGVLGVWAVVGFTLAPVVLRRMARRESGSNLAARREKVARWSR